VQNSCWALVLVAFSSCRFSGDRAEPRQVAISLVLVLDCGADGKSYVADGPEQQPQWISSFVVPRWWP
jgi:hypothetical protein